MRSLARRASVIAGVGLAVGSSAAMGAERHHHDHHLHHHGRLPAYDLDTEITLEGDIDELVRLQRPGCPSCEEGTHIFLSGHDVEIHLLRGRGRR